MIVELKAVTKISNVFAVQCLNYLQATDLPVCLLLNCSVKRCNVLICGRITTTNSPEMNMDNHR